MRKRLVHILFFISVALMNAQNMYSSQYRFEHFSNHKGFNQNTISIIEQDKYNFLWFGTPNGLIKYDGYEFVSYTNDSENKSSISNNNIQSLKRDKSGNLWIGTFEGGNVYVPLYEKFLKIPFPDDFIANSIKSGPNEKIWYSGSNDLYRCELIKEGSDYSFGISENIIEFTHLNYEITDFCFINEKELLISLDTGLICIHLGGPHNSKVLSVNQFEKFKDQSINLIFKDDNIYYLGTREGLYKIIPDGKEIIVLEKINFRIHKEEPLADLEILSLFKDKQDNMWVGTAQNGIFRLDDKTGLIDHFGYDPKDSNGISSPRINCFYQDNFDIIWIGTAQGGVNKLDLKQKRFLSYSHNPYESFSIGGDLIMDILEDKNGRLWISEYNGTVSRSTGPVSDQTAGELRFNRIENRIPKEKSENISTLFQDNNGFIWLSTETEVFVYDPIKENFKKVYLYEKGKEIQLSFIKVIDYFDSSGILIAGSKVCLLRNPWENLNAGATKIEVETVFEKGVRTHALYKSSHGFYWIGTEMGLYQCRLEGGDFKEVKVFKNTDDKFAISNNNVFSILEGPDNNLWVGTFGGGLNKLTLNESGGVLGIDYFRKNGILPDDAVYGILVEDNSHLWLSTDMGLCRLNIKTNEIEVFDVRDGLINNNFRQGCYFKGQSGFYYFGGLNGLTVFKPNEIQLNEISSHPLIYGISVNNDRLEIGEEVGGNTIMYQSSFESNNLSFKHSAKILTFHVLSQHYSSPLKNRLAYTLEGFNNDWIYTEEGKFDVTYTNLPPGEYVFRLKSANSDGFWSGSTTDLAIRIFPPWYKTWWSLTIFAVIALGLIIAGFTYFVRLEKLQQRLKYEQIDKKRIDTLNQGKLQFFTNISHEFRTPITLIASPLEKVIERNRDKESAHYLSIIQNNTQRLMNLIDQLITFRKAEQGRLELQFTEDKLGKFIYPTTEAFEHYAIQKNINFFYKVDFPNEKVIIDVEKVERIIFNLLANSFRYTPANGQVSLESTILSKEDRKIIRLKVIDTGKGIPENKREIIFERFYRLEEGNSSPTGGTGIGLAYCKSLVDLMDGEITIQSEPHVRTCFTVLIPSASPESIKKHPYQQGWKSFVKDWMPQNTVKSEEISDEQSINTKQFSLVIVDDEPEVRNFLRKELEENYSIQLAENGKDALIKIQSKEPDLIISDVMMPEMNGFELCEKLKSTADTAHIPVILLTALEDDENKLKGLEYGADGYISKPFSTRYLEMKVKKLIENNRKIKEHFSRNSKIPDKHIEMSKRDRLFLKMALEAIDKNISDSGFGVEELAYEIGLSPSQFYRRLKQLTGQVPNVYLRNYRLQRAAELLRSNEGFTVSEVMYQIGIESSSYFSTSFKKLHGSTPSEYIKS